jgi:outer membrane lipoprotein-sorting protein
MRIPFAALVVLGCFVPALRPAIAAEEPAPAVKVVNRMDAALDPDRPSIRALRFHVSGRGGDTEITVGEARRKIGNVTHEVDVVLAPESLRGTAFLVEQTAADYGAQWIYAPANSRVRKLLSAEAYSPFLNSDFTYADLGLASMKTRYSLSTEEARRDTRAYRIDGIPEDASYFTRTVTWVAVDSEIPLERELYDVEDRLWKVERFEEPTVIDGVPTIRRITMKDVQARTRTDIEVDAVRYDVDVPATLFDPTQLQDAVHSPVWRELGGV